MNRSPVCDNSMQFKGDCFTKSKEKAKALAKVLENKKKREEKLKIKNTEKKT